MGTDRIVELERKISELENQLKIEKEKQGTIGQGKANRFLP